MEEPYCPGPHRFTYGVKLLCFACVCLLTGCAAEAPPRPPRIQIPRTISNLKVAQAGRTLILTFTLPRRATDGRGITKPVEARIYRQITPPGSPAPAAFTASKPRVMIAARNLARFERGRAVTYRDELAPADFARSLGSQFSFWVVTLTRSFRGHPHISEPSNIVKMLLLNVAPPIQELQARQTPGGVTLRWTAPSESLTGSPLAPLSAYRVYRGLKTQPGVFAFLAKTSLPQYLDPHIQFGETYLYEVQAVFAESGAKAMTMPSQPVEVTPRDIFPPPPPVGLTAVYTGSSVQLLWKPELIATLAGYNVYRQEAEAPPTRLNRGLLPVPAFTDATAAPDQRYIYWVTAVSSAHHESKPSKSTAVETK